MLDQLPRRRGDYRVPEAGGEESLRPSNAGLLITVRYGIQNAMQQVANEPTASAVYAYKDQNNHSIECLEGLGKKRGLLNSHLAVKAIVQFLDQEERE